MVAWPDGVNQKAYAMNTDYEDNLVRVEFECGKSRTYLKNSAPKRTFSFSLRFEDVGENSEYKKFLNWYNNVCLSGSQSFQFPDLIMHTTLSEYKFTETPSARGQKFKEVNLSVIEQ